MTLDHEARRAVAYAREEARTLRHEHVGTEHLLLGLLRLDGGEAGDALETVGVTLGRARAEILRSLGQGSRSGGGELPFTPRAKKRLELAGDEAEAVGAAEAGPAHLLLSLAREREGGAARVLDGLGVDRDTLVGETRRRLGRGPDDERRAQPARLASTAAWALPMLVGALLLAAGILIGWAIWGH
jgi:ATP-dependent Clp protease ATP-binding subunit ClpC